MSETEIEVEQEIVSEVRRLPAVRAAEAMVARGEVTSQEVVAQRDKIREVMDAVMVEGVHYGKVPGVSKPTLLKPGAEVLAVTFRFAPHYASERVFHDDGHLTVFSKATLQHIPTSLVVAEGEGLCTSREKKYAFRGEGRTCPSCGVAGSIKRSKFPPREDDYPGADRSDAPGWYCYAKVGGCGANFAATDPAIIDQETGKITNPDLPDTWNTVLKMANKRALVAAILNGTAASDIFTQDVEDLGTAAADSGETRQEKAGRDETPRSWAEINAWAEPYGPSLGWRQWVLDASNALFGDVEWADLEPAQRTTLGQKASGAIIALRDAHDPGDFPGPTRETVQKAWAAVLEGEILPGPEWRMSPDETDLPLYQAPDDEPSGDIEAEAEEVVGEVVDEAEAEAAEGWPSEEELREVEQLDF